MVWQPQPDSTPRPTAASAVPADRRPLESEVRVEPAARQMALALAVRRVVAAAAAVAQLPQALLARAASAAWPLTLHLMLEIHSVVLAVQVVLLPQELVALVVLVVLATLFLLVMLVVLAPAALVIYLADAGVGGTGSASDTN